ncbi:MAG: CoB--CoM heterodisulfide reductase iron-sulfur subunit B family protein [Armatimonadetes bacterium]|nr:CoB--CoM heterodisulfide reductase iron-sulfur subunit B family protein [Armatimonadota bacterium]
MKYSFFPGCSLESTAGDFRMSTYAVANALGIELEELPGWSCCGSTPAHATDSLLAASLPARNLAIAQDLGRDVIVCCAACYGRLAAANLAVEDATMRAEVAEAIGREYAGGVRVRHFLQVLRDDIGLADVKDAITKSLNGLKVACYYGCLLTRPKELSILDDPEDPQLMEEILVAAGADPIEWPYKTECCGASFSITRTDTVKRLGAGILEMAKESGAECIAVACPLCQSNLDLRQSDIEQSIGKQIGLPVFYFTQLLGRALGLSDDALGIGKLMTDPIPLLGRI